MLQVNARVEALQNSSPDALQNYMWNAFKSIFERLLLKLFSFLLDTVQSLCSHIVNCELPPKILRRWSLKNLCANFLHKFNIENCLIMQILHSSYRFIMLCAAKIELRWCNSSFKMLKCSPKALWNISRKSLYIFFYSLKDFLQMFNTENFWTFAVYKCFALCRLNCLRASLIPVSDAKETVLQNLIIIWIT